MKYSKNNLQRIKSAVINYLIKSFFVKKIKNIKEDLLIYAHMWKCVCVLKCTSNLWLRFFDDPEFQSRSPCTSNNKTRSLLSGHFSHLSEKWILFEKKWRIGSNPFKSNLVLITAIKTKLLLCRLNGRN